MLLDVIWAEDSFLYAPRLAAPNPDTPTTPPSDHDSSAISIPIVDDEPVPAPIPHVPVPIPVPAPAPIPIHLPPPSESATPPRIQSPLPVPAAPRCGTHQRYMPKEFWQADAPLILQAPHPDTPPSPSPSTSVHQPLVEDSLASNDESESSDDSLAMEALEQSLLTFAGIDKEYVHFTIDQAIQYAHSGWCGE
ncbi:hypothetical protein FRC18_007813 [Serendipita sp. 400]|nr:hypothetical protein FRC18_007813 [Serendipita sp. 400]